MNPNLVQIELTSYCNLTCSMCPHKCMTRPKGNMSFELFKKVVDECKSLSWPINWLHSWGEPLLHPEIGRFMEYFKKYGLGDGGISTNGVALTDRNRSLLIKHAKLVRVAIDSFDENVYTKLRGLNYQLVVNNLNSLIKEARGTDLKIEVQLLRTALNSCETNNDYPIKYKNIIKYPDAEDLTINKPFTCVPNNHLELCVLWDGRLSGCCYDYNGEMIFGDITTDSLLTQWAKWSRNTNKDKNTLCKRCAYYESQ